MDKIQREKIRRAQRLTHYHAAYWEAPAADWPLYPFCVEEAVRDNEVRFSETNCRYLLINLVSEGELLYADRRGGEYLVAAGQIFVVPPGASYSFRTTPARHYRKIVLELSGTLLAQIAGSLRLATCRWFAPGAPRGLETALLKLRTGLEESGEAERPRLIGQAWEILAGLAQAGREESPREKALRAARSWLERNLSGKLTIARLCRELGLCQSLLDRWFRENVKLTPQQYRIEYRHRQARHLLAQTSLSAKEIAARLGYSNQLYFSNEFKRLSGLSPRAFRQSEADDSAARQGQPASRR